MRSRLVLGLAVVLAACSGGGGSSTIVLPSPPWGNFRQNNSNAGASSLINTNTGTVSLPIPIVDAEGNALTTLSTPTIDLSGNVLIATQDGIRAYAPGCFVFPPAPAPTPAGQCPLWTFTACTPPCSNPPCASPTPVTVGSVSASPSVTAGGTVVVGSDGDDGQPGHLFAFQEQGTSVTCLWVYPPIDRAGASFTTKSSAATVINSDLTLAGAFVGGDDGQLLALNPDGSVRWSYESEGPITSSPALDANTILYITTQDGRLAAINFAGQQVAQFPFPIGSPPDEPFQPSPATNTTTTYAIGAAGTVYGINPNGTQKWSPPVTLPLPPSGSPAFLTQSFNVGPTLTFDTIVYVVDVEGTAYGLRDVNGRVVQVQRCLPSSPTLDCMTDSCLPNDKCNTATNLCTISGVACTPDSCTTTGDTCQVSPGIKLIPETPVAITTSPAVSGDPFVVVGTTDGQVCARNLDGTVPGQDLTTTSGWETGNGCVQLPDATKSSPIIGLNGVIYVTTDKALYAIQ